MVRGNGIASLALLLMLMAFGAVSGSPDCKHTVVGQDYQGNISKSRSGFTCQPWKQQFPQKHKFTTADVFPDNTIEDAVNYCRNPDGSSGGPWCYTASNHTYWEYCDVPLCRKCKESVFGQEYQGRTAVTTSGRRCQFWKDQYPHKHMFDTANRFPDSSLNEAANYCRNPTGVIEGLWCYTTDPNKRWDYCDIPLCQCKNTELGQEFKGDIAETITGRKCQLWSDQHPHVHLFTTADDFPDKSMSDVTNYCRNPDGDSYGPWCFTTDPEMRWEYCDVPLCGNCKHTDLGKEYRGTVAVTQTGRTCQSWSHQEPHEHRFKTADKFPDDCMRDVSNYCRNPDGEIGGPWCYTTDPNKRWEFCGLPLCSNCKKSVFGQEYRGNKDVTESGKSCQRWDRQYPHEHVYGNNTKFPNESMAEVANYCRNPSRAENGPWCYTTDPDKRWEWCGIPFCEVEDPKIETETELKPTPVEDPEIETELKPTPECKHTTLGQGYRGHVTVTKSGKTCQPWSAQYPHRHSFTTPAQFPDDSISQMANNCRNPDGEPEGVWCYTTNPDTRWENCDVPLCLEDPEIETELKPTPECKHTTLGQGYRGHVTVTKSGKTCLLWSAQYPHRHSFTTPAQFPDDSISQMANNCRNPDGEPEGVWCYTTNPDTRWENCDVPLCPCKSTNIGQEFRGNISMTYSGKHCQSWSSQYPHKHKFKTPDKFPDKSMSDVANYCSHFCVPCATATAAVGLPQDPDFEWEACGVPQCQDCKKTLRGKEYQGTIAVTQTGKTCQSWRGQYPHQHKYSYEYQMMVINEDSMRDPANYCRNPSGAAGGPWCYTTDPKIRWEYCGLPDCSDCKLSRLGQEYLGTKNVTVSGETCQRWYSQRPHNHGFKTANKFLDNSMKELANYCRNPDGEPNGPWCYTTNPSKRWEYCDVPLCFSA